MLFELILLKLRITIWAYGDGFGAGLEKDAVVAATDQGQSVWISTPVIEFIE